MIEIFLFIFKYKIKKNCENLSLHCREFYLLSSKKQNKVLDIYFDNLDDDIDIGYYFDNKNARYYQNGMEVSFFSSYYFCKKMIEFNINNIVYFDKFDISDNDKDKLVKYSLDIIRENNIRLDINKILTYPNNLPEALSSNIEFISYLVSIDYYNIKYITYNHKYPEKQRELIRMVIDKIKDDDFSLKKFMINDKVLPKILIYNIDFLIYLVENDIDSLKYLDDKIFDKFTLNDKKRFVESLIKCMNKFDISADRIFKLDLLANYLDKDCDFLIYIINRDVDNVKYVNFHNIVTGDIKRIIDFLSLKLVRENIDFDYKKYPFSNIFKQNYMFMAYLIDRDRHNIREVEINNRDEVNRLIDIYLNKYRKCEFMLDDYLDDMGMVKDIFVSNKYMFAYLIRNDNQIFKYIDFMRIDNFKTVLDVMLKEMDKKYFVFDNECFLRNGKYPVALSNSYRFMRYVIDKNFNNLSYIDISMIDNKELKRIINYAFRMVYYIRGNNRNLNFDIDGYFKDSDIIHNEYFQECFRSL